MDLHFESGTYGTQLAPVTRLGPVDAASICVAGVVLGDIDLHFVWHATHLMTWTFTLCGSRGTYGTQLAPVTRLDPVDAASLCVAGVALGDIDLLWQAWHLVTWTFSLCGRRGTCGTQLAPVTCLGPVDAASLCVAGVALGDIDLQFAWQAWHLVTWTFTLCGRRGTYGTPGHRIDKLGRTIICAPSWLRSSMITLPALCSSCLA
eukprot:s2754_g8.t1